MKTNKELKKIVEIKDLIMYLKVGKNKKLIINNTGFDVNQGEIFGIIGESGSGKTVLTKTLFGLNSNIQMISSGKIILDGKDVTNFKTEDWQKSGVRGKVVSSVFQNPLSSLNPYRRIGAQIIESILENKTEKISKAEAYDRALELLEMVKIHEAAEVMKMYPHQLSGGMNQRVVIVSILAANPKLIIFDEPTTALDPIAQAQIIEIAREIRDKFKTSMIFISHDVSLISSIADRIGIMYAGKIVELGTTDEIINFPLHPYTWGLLRSIPNLDSDELYSIPGAVPISLENIEGDPFAPRNEYSLKIDFILKPPKVKFSDTHYVWSWLYDENVKELNPPKMIKRKWEKYSKKQK